MSRRITLANVHYNNDRNQWPHVFQLNYQLLADFNSTTSQAFGLAFYASQKVTDRYLAAMNLKNPLQKNAAGDKRLVLPAPAIYVIDSQGDATVMNDVKAKVLAVCQRLPVYS